MFALDLFNTDHERRLTEGAVDQLEQRRIDDLAMKMDDLVARAKQATTPEHKAALIREFQKAKAERDSYFKVRNETMGYGSLVGEELSGDELNQRMAQLGKDADASIMQSINKQSDDRIAALKNPPKPKSFMQQVGDKQIGMVKGAWKGLTGKVEEAEKNQDIADKEWLKKMGREPQGSVGKAVDTAKQAAKWLAGKGGPGKEGPTYEAAQKKNSKKIDETRLAIGDPIVVTGPNEFEGKTGEIYEFSPSGSFVIVDLYNHGRHSMHLSDIAYNEYADQEQDDDDDWYDEMDEGWYDSKSFPGAKIGTHIAGPAPTPVPQVKDQIIKLLMSTHKDLVDKHGQRDVNIVAQSEAAKAEPTPQGIKKAVNNVINFLTSGLSVNRLKQQTLEDDMSEGFQDFNKVEPYAVCLAGKPVKKFDYYEQARRFHDNWKKKLYREGNKEKADKITLMPLNLDEEEQKPAGWGEFPPKQEITIVPPKKLKSGETYQDQNKYWQSQGQAPIYKTNEAEGRVDPILIKALKRMPDGLATHRQVLDAAYDAYAIEKGYLAMKGNHGITDVYIPQLMDLYKQKHGLTFNESASEGSWIVYDPKTKQIKKRFKTHTAGKSYAKVHNLGFASSEHYFDNVKEKTVDEGLMKDPTNRKEYLEQRNKLFRMLSIETDPASKQIIKQAIKELESRFSTAKDPVKEESSTSSDAVERAILNRIMVAHTDLLMKFGPEKVMQAAEEVAYNVGDVDEIGSSDVSAYVDQVKQILGVPEELDEKWSQKYKSSINCANPKGFSQKAHCAGRKK